ncbi:MAG: hypothetical protein EXR18_08015 [Flavobacteriaceae bacterium]|nr:hypothetical protein [Flavobacteriaceae bacterium]
MNFRKHICILLAFLLLVSNVGFAFNVHYCGDEIASVSLKSAFSSNNTEENCCGIVEEKSHCCKNKVLHFQKKSETSSFNIIAFNSDFLFFKQDWKPFQITSTPNFKRNSITSYFCDANAPPFFKLYSQYIFYA